MISKYLAPSKSKQHLTLDLNKLSDQQIKNILSDWLPNQIIKIGPFYFYYLLKSLYPDSLWFELLDYISESAANIACRGKLKQLYLKKEYLYDSNLVILCTTYDKGLYEKYGIDLLNGIFIGNYGPSQTIFYHLNKTESYINAVCFRDLGLFKIRIGLNDNFVDFYPKRKNIYYNVHPQYKYYIDIDDSTIVKQKCMRFFDNIKQDMNLMNDLVSDNPKFIKQISKAIHTECNSKYILKWMNKWKKDYDKQGYQFMDRDDILKEVSVILKSEI